uniref:U-box domain-containing protein n=1 Tax=Polytomella parva TaxID=51329 RepID=A0A7S0UYH0_9CHLO|mmetsp:Transcript_21004/g.37505  ORF Transcript_21004/g.37505 Transcript_21004/m.37505 type:complete len:261 (+) Transcript_21004:126-908(+)
MTWWNSLLDSLMKSRPTSTIVSICSIIVLGCLALQSQYFILQLFDDTDKQSRRFLNHLSNLVSKGSLTRSFLPPEFHELEPDSEGVYTYSAGKSCFNLLFRSSKETEGLWECSENGELWLTTEAVLDGDYNMFEPPTLFFITRLHFEYLLRCRASSNLKIQYPPPLDTSRAKRATDLAPDCLCCPISQELMSEPVVLPSGKTFDRRSVIKWLTSHGRDPTSGAPLAEDELFPNLALREVIEKWMAQDHVDGQSSGAVDLA